MLEDRFADSDRRAFDDVLRKFKFSGSEHHNGRTAFEVAEFLALEKIRVAWNVGGASISETESCRNKVQTNARHQDGSNWNERQI